MQTQSRERMAWGLVESTVFCRDVETAFLAGCLADGAQCGAVTFHTADNDMGPASAATEACIDALK